MNNQVIHDIEEQNTQTAYQNDILNMEQSGSIVQSQGSVFLTTIIFACKAVIACAGQLNIMGKEHSNENYGDVLAYSANAIILAIKEDKILSTRLSIAFAQISQIIEREVSNFTEGKTYILFFDSVAKSFLRFQNDEQLTANTWLTVLTCVNEMLSKNSKQSLGAMLDVLICAEHKLRDVLDSDLNPIDAFGEVVNATETFALQTVHMPRLHSINSTDHKIYKYPDPRVHAVCVWMRAAYEAVKLKYL